MILVTVLRHHVCPVNHATQTDTDCGVVETANVFSTEMSVCDLLEVVRIVVEEPFEELTQRHRVSPVLPASVLFQRIGDVQVAHVQFGVEPIVVQLLK